MEIEQKEEESKLLRTWWPKRTMSRETDADAYWFRSRDDADGFWFRDMGWELQIIKETLSRYRDSIVVEERVGYGCQSGWEMKAWRLKDNSLFEKSVALGCREFDDEAAERNAGTRDGIWNASNNLSHFQIRSEVVRGLVVNLCPYHFIEEFPELAAALGVKIREAAQETTLEAEKKPAEA